MSFSTALSRLRRTYISERCVEVDVSDDISNALPYLFWIESDPVRFFLSPAALRMQGGFIYSPQHPFVRTLRDGASALADFYSCFRPRDICEMYGIEKAGNIGERLPPWELPWLMRKNRFPPPGEAGLRAEDGVSFYGPATTRKVQVEISRLRDTLEKIQRNGYQPDIYGDIEGHFIQCQGQLAFYVRGGKHRAAALTHLGFKKVPVRIRATWPRLISEDGSSHWPLVAQGCMARDLGLRILAAFVKGR